MSRRIVKDHGGHLVNQPRLSLFAYCEKATVVMEHFPEEGLTPGKNRRLEVDSLVGYE